MPGEDEDRQMYHLTKKLLAEKGYERYEISNYARKGRECRHNVGYWTRQDYLGFGLGAASLYGNLRFANTADWNRYLENSSDPEQIREKEPVLTTEDEMAEFMFLGLRLTEGVSFVRFRQRFGKEMDTVYGKELQELAELGLLLRDESGVRLSRRGIDVSNAVFERFLL